MFHYWTGNEPAEVRQAQIEDWIEDLAEFGPKAVIEACAEWRRQPQSRRPTPGEIRALCREQRPQQSDLMALPAPDSEQDARRMAEEWAISRGYMSLEDYQRQSYTGVSVKMSHGGWFRFPGLRVPAVEQSINAPTSAADLGVTAREYRPSAEQMAAGRRALGLE